MKMVVVAVLCFIAFGVVRYHSNPKVACGLSQRMHVRCELPAFFLQAVHFNSGATRSQGELNLLMLVSIFMLLFCFFALSKNAKHFIELRIL